MNEYQDNLYTQLMELTSNNEAFYFQDFSLDGHVYRIFNYRLASYTDFQQPGAMECRGVMFRIHRDEHKVELVALPMEKFFNLNENPMTMGLDLTQIDEILLKADGSLMSTYIHDGDLKIKSKGSIASEQCVAAMEMVERYRTRGTDQEYQFAQTLYHFTNDGWTVNMEWCSPVHRIVIGYEKPHLQVLNVRSRLSGEYMTYDQLVHFFGDYVVARVQPSDPVAFVASIPSMTEDIEGYVIRLKSGQRVKIKTEKYLSLHHAKDSVNNPRRLFEAILDEGIDDLRSMFYTDVVAMKMIDEMQDKVDHLYNHMVKTVEDFYAANKHMERKDYAIKGQTELDRLFFGLAMTKYLDKPVDYKGFMKSKYKEFGVRDTQQEEV